VLATSSIRLFNPRYLTYVTCYDLASNICQALSSDALCTRNSSLWVVLTM
jgi:hypothetical protein